MYIIIQYIPSSEVIGILQGGQEENSEQINNMLYSAVNDKNGNLIFSDYESAKSFAEAECSFWYKVVELDPVVVEG